jgi:hypothetical protein
VTCAVSCSKTVYRPAYTAARNVTCQLRPTLPLSILKSAQPVKADCSDAVRHGLKRYICTDAGPGADAVERVLMKTELHSYICDEYLFLKVYIDIYRLICWVNNASPAAYVCVE